jgi:hypothetical protein
MSMEAIEKTLGTHASILLICLGVAKDCFNYIQVFAKTFLGIGLQPILWV